MLELRIRHDKPAVEKILTATLRLVGRAEIDAVSMREIAAEAGVSKSLLHYHFGSKEHLVIELATAIVNAIVARVAAVTECLNAAGRPDVLTASLDAIWRELVGAQDLSVLLLRLAARGTADAAIREQIAHFRSRVRDLMAGGIRRSLPADRVEAVPVEAAAELLLATVLGLGAERPFVEDIAPLEAGFGLLRTLLTSFAGGTPS